MTFWGKVLVLAKCVCVCTCFGHEEEWCVCVLMLWSGLFRRVDIQFVQVSQRVMHHMVALWLFLLCENACWEMVALMSLCIQLGYGKRPYQDLCLLHCR